MKTLASRIQQELQVGEWKYCAVYENELKRLWPPNEKDRKAKMEQFAKEYGFRLSVYRPGLCAIFEEGLNDAAAISSTSIQDGKYSGYRIQCAGYSASLANDSRTALADGRQTTRSASPARCFPNDDGLFTLLHIAGIVLESQMAHNPAPCATDDFYACLRSSATSRQTWRRSNLRRFAFRCAVVRRGKCSQQCNQLREVSQPLTQCSDSRLQCGGQRDREARARKRFQRLLKKSGHRRERTQSR